MTAKADFNAEEWEKITEAPPMAAMVVIVAERGGTIRESMAVGKVYSEAREKQTGTPLLDEVVAGLPSIRPSKSDSPEELRANALAEIREAVALLENKGTGEEVEAYRQFIVALAERVAEADKSGGFLGIGGQRVSEKEQAAIEEIRAAVA